MDFHHSEIFRHLELKSQSRVEPEAQSRVEPEAQSRVEPEAQSRAEDWGEVYENSVRPKVARLLRLLKLDKTFISAKGDELVFEEKGQRQVVQDFLGGYGCSLLGHHHPVVTRAWRKALDDKMPSQAQGSIKNQAAKLADKINRLLERERSQKGLQTKNYVVTLTNSGAETVEAALKHALMAWQQKKEKLLNLLEYKFLMASGEEKSALAAKTEELVQMQPQWRALQRAFHGKTSGAASVTGNPLFSNMFAQKPIPTSFIEPGETKENLAAEFEAHCCDLSRWKLPKLNAICGVMVETLQAEGGVHDLSAGFLTNLEACSQGYGIPLIVDEIQTGLGRCGSLFDSIKKGLDPDYILLGKGLGGGLAKIGALVVARSKYIEDFGVIHTSTFAEDDPSSYVALQTLAYLGNESTNIATLAERFETRVKSEIQQLQGRFPGVIQDFRGRGFLLGIEFSDGAKQPWPFFLRALFRSGYGAYFLASYLLNHHGLRLGVTLSSPQTLRIEPSLLISEQAQAQLITGLRKLVTLLYHENLEELTSHLWKEPLRPTSSLFKKKLHGPSHTPVAFFCHLINIDHARKVDPLLDRLSERDLSKVMDCARSLELDDWIQQIGLEDLYEQKINLHLQGLFLTSDDFERELRSGRAQIKNRIQRLIEELEDQGIRHIGLGQFTSIVTWNGLSLKTKRGTLVTTGNSLTVAATLEVLRKILAERGQSLAESHVGIVGVTGNICQVMAQIIGDEARKMTVIYRESLKESEKFRLSLQSVMQATSMNPTLVKATHEMSALRECDVIIIGTNATQPILKPEHLKDSAIVIDVSVPTNIHPEVFSFRTDVVCFRGGLIQFPGQQWIGHEVSPTPMGQSYACLAETALMAFRKRTEPYSLGPLKKENVFTALKDAYEAGYQIGGLRPVKEGTW